MLGQQVKVKAEQPNRIGDPLYPGRVGTVVKENPFGRGEHGGLWYVELEPTKRAKARTHLFKGDELEVQ